MLVMHVTTDEVKVNLVPSALFGSKPLLRFCSCRRSEDLLVLFIAFSARELSVGASANVVAAQK